MEVAQAHLQWIKNHPNYIPPEGNVIDNTTTGGGRVIPHYESMSAFYQGHPKACTIAEQWFRSDVRHHNLIVLKTHQYEASFLKDAPRCYFVTIGFIDSADIETLHKIVQTIITFDWVVKFLGVLEFNTEKGLHPHVHIYLHCNLPKSKVIEKLYATKGLKKVCTAKNFIDCDHGLPCHKDYVLGIKQDSKEEFVKADRALRKCYNIPDLFEK